VSSCPPCSHFAVTLRKVTQYCHVVLTWCFFFSCCRFRDEYRSERRLLNDISNITGALGCDVDDDIHDSRSPQPVPPSRHAISRVVVVHNNKTEVFLNHNDAGCRLKGDMADSGLSSNDFFDNDLFWNGSITWY
jgi:hypothetical protein